MSDSSSALQTPLYPLHIQLEGKMVDFAGYLLPLTYKSGGLLAEHLHTRQSASLFDVSHMGQIAIRRSAASEQVLSALVPADINAIAAGNAKYTLLTNSSGGVIDDCIITSDGDAGWFIVINASRKAVDIAHIKSALAAQNAADTLTEYTDRALLAVQGPAAAAIVESIFPAAATLTFMQSIVHESPFGDCRLSRCGYTGEDGFEISVAAAHAGALAQQLLADDACKPAGLGARDSLRLEAGLCLYGNELDEDILPTEAGLLWTIPAARRQAEAGYAGAAAISEQIKNGAPRRLAALLPQSKTPVRRGAEIYYQSQLVGSVTSGVYSPTLQAPIALALIAADTPRDAELTTSVRGRYIICTQTSLPFVKHNYRR